jgi:hypothetical protein
LCGRGGLSNHHAGNEWYRRLIRSNRPLYKACPKHTKLLVSKAIVQAVEQQGGRFLEKDKATGAWHIVSYKRAVDKTSQGLREREREDDKDETHDETTEVPEGFRGESSKGPNLNDLADVAVAHANRDKAKDNGKKRPAAPAPATHTKRQRMQASTAAPLPPRTTVEGESSMSQLLKQTQLLPGSTTQLLSSCKSWAGPPQQQVMAYPTKLNHLQLLEKNHTYSQPAPAQQQSGMFSLFRNRQALGPAPQGVFLPQQHRQQSQFIVSGFQQQQPLHADGAPPPLSRLTSQVSDWLQSFWPIGSRPNDDAIPSAITKQIQIPEPIEKEKPVITTVPPPKLTKSSTVANGPPNTNTRKRGTSLKPFPNASSSAPATSAAVAAACPLDSDADPVDVALASIPPSELEQSVSATLLKLASTPSKLFSGLTSFFGPNEEAASSQRHPPPSIGLSKNGDGDRRPSLSKISLLDDYEETPDEARLRNIVSK